MADIRTEPQSDAAQLVERPATAPPSGEPSLAELFKQLAQESTTLIRQEVALAKAEMRENVRTATRSATMVVVGGLIALIGVLVLTAFLVIVLGQALANFWLAALIVGAVFLLIGGGIAWSGLNKLKTSEMKPEHTIDSLKEDRQWIQQEIREARRELT